MVFFRKLCINWWNPYISVEINAYLGNILWTKINNNSGVHASLLTLNLLSSLYSALPLNGVALYLISETIKLHLVTPSPRFSFWRNHIFKCWTIRGLLVHCFMNLPNLHVSGWQNIGGRNILPLFLKINALNRMP